MAPDRSGNAPAPSPIETISLLGTPLRRPVFDPARRAVLEADLSSARANRARDPSNETNIIWLGRRLAYLGRYNDALAVFDDGLKTHPDSFRLLRHAGHRLITLRRFEAAVDRLSRAAALIHDLPDEVEPDGAPNALNLPRSTTHSNIWYHLGLAHFLLGEHERALPAFRACLGVSTNDDMLVAVTHWLWMTLQRLRRHDEAADALRPIRPEMEIIENQAYHRLCLLYQSRGLGANADEPGLIAPSAHADDWAASAMGDAALAFGLAHLDLVEGRREQAMAGFRRIVQTHPWASFGAIAAEAELLRAR